MWLLKQSPQSIHKPWTALFFFYRLQTNSTLSGEKKNILKRNTETKKKNGGNAFNDRETGLGISHPFHQAHAKWFQVSQCDQEKVWSQKGK